MQPGADAFRASYRTNTGNGAQHSAFGPPGARQITGRNRTKTGKRRNLSLQQVRSRRMPAPDFYFTKWKTVAAGKLWRNWCLGFPMSRSPQRTFSWPLPKQYR